MREQDLPNRKIIWAVTREEHAKGKSLMSGSSVVCSNLSLFDSKAERAEEVLILQDHPKAKACALYYEKMGATVRGYSMSAEPKDEEPKEDKKKK